MSRKKLSHFDEDGAIKMVGISQKADTLREATACGTVHLSTECVRLIKGNAMKKGNPLEIARIAGIMAAKRTHELIPLCHPLLISKVDIDLKLKKDRILIESRVVCAGKTGVEMEALTAVSVAALTIYDMSKSVDKSIIISDIHLLQKKGGQSGNFKFEHGHKES